MTVDSSQANVEFFFRLLYDCIRGACYGDTNLSWLPVLLAKIWLWIVYVGYAVSVLAIFLIVYITVRIFELRKREEEYYGTLILAPEAEQDGHPRWAHIKSLVEGSNPSEWKEAIIEADILLEEVLTNAGYDGKGVGEKLANANTLTFRTLEDAWEAHKVRNQIAHEGSSYQLTETVVRRTMARFENVFREFKLV
jgi:hypothetical protein